MISERVIECTAAWIQLGIARRSFEAQGECGVVGGEPLLTVCIGKRVSRRRPGCLKVRNLPPCGRRDLRLIEYDMEL